MDNIDYREITQGYAENDCIEIITDHYDSEKQQIEMLIKVTIPVVFEVDSGKRENQK